MGSGSTIFGFEGRFRIPLSISENLNTHKLWWWWGGGGWHDACSGLLSEAGGAHWPLATHALMPLVSFPCTFFLRGWRCPLASRRLGPSISRPPCTWGGGGGGGGGVPIHCE